MDDEDVSETILLDGRGEVLSELLFAVMVASQGFSFRK